MKIILTALALAGSAASAGAADITEAAIGRHIDVLASDAYEGRKPGTAGETKTITYIAGAFRDAGLSPGAADGGWYEPVRLVERSPERTNASFAAGGKSLIERELVLIGREAGVRIAGAPVLFAGHGIVADGRDDLTGADLTGAVVLVRGGAPSGMAHAPSMRDRIRLMVERDAAAVIVIAAPDARWDTVRQAAQRPATSLAGTRVVAATGTISHAAFLRLVPDGAAMLASAEADGFRASARLATATLDVRTTVRPFTSYNVIGRRVGTGATGETVLFSGHWDHLGSCGPESSPDRICNGAVDNASGIASMIETARALGQGKRPMRDEVFIATTAEELGLLGMEAWAERPTVPLAGIVAAINVDTVAVAPSGLPVAIIGRGRFALDGIVDATARALGRKVDADLDANAFIDRQDGAVLSRRGVPAVMIGGSFSDLKRLQRFLSGPYHKPADNPGSGVELGGATEDANLTVAVARRLVDPARYPRP